MKYIILIFALYFSSCAAVKRANGNSHIQVARGVEVIQSDYVITKDGKQLPTKLFLFDIELSNKVTIVATSAEDNNASIKGSKDEKTAIAPISKQLEAMQANRKQIKVLGGVNADFYHINRSNMIEGVMYRNSQPLKQTMTDSSNIFAILKDGTAMCITQQEYKTMDKSLIAEAVCGRVMLLNDGVAQSDEGDTFHPRTAVGVTKDGKRVFILVGDGRREGYSHGLSYKDMIEIFKELGAYDAINLDGGGSSSFALPAGNGEFAPLNRPSDRSGERSVPNGLAVVKIKR